MQQPEATICVLTYNRPDFLADALRSILAQTWSDFQLVILDNASIVNYSPVINRIVDKRVKYIRHENNIGFLGNYEYALSHYSATPFLMIFHDDDFMHPELLERQIRLLRNEPDLSWVCPLSQDFRGQLPKFEAQLKGNVKILHSCYELVDLIYRRWHICIGHVLMRTSSLKDVAFHNLVKECDGLFDRPFLLELMRYGRAGILLDNLVFYRSHSSNVSLVEKWSAENVINLSLHYKKAVKEDPDFRRRVRFHLLNSYYLIEGFSRLGKDARPTFLEFCRISRQAGVLDWWSPLLFAAGKSLSHIRRTIISKGFFKKVDESPSHM